MKMQRWKDRVLVQRDSNNCIRDYRTKDQTNGSGLAARTVTVNGDELTSKAKNFVVSITGSNQIVQEDSLTLSANDLKNVREGENTVVTTYTDIAGNKTID